MSCGERARDSSGLTHKPSALELVSKSDDKMAGVYRNVNVSLEAGLGIVSACVA
jgi:hypothetical protein